MTDSRKVDFIVVGSGIAGLRTALELKHYGEVLILTKTVLSEGSTEHAQGGVAVVYSSIDRPKFHFADTVNAGNGICNPVTVWKMVEDGPDRVKELMNWGVAFDVKGRHFSFTKEGAHRVSRVLHSGGDATGANIETVLIGKIRAAGIEFLEETRVSELIVKDGEVHGLIAFIKGERTVIWSKAVFVATGGVGQLYRNTTNPPVSTGDGSYFAFQAGAEVMDMEFIQFHPTSFAREIYPRFLITEAVRGEGGILRNSKGEAFMEKYHPMKDLAARDIVARAIHNELKLSKQDHVMLDISSIGVERFEKRFPTIFKTLSSHGHDLSSLSIPVVPAAHYFMGGIRIDASGASSLKNLYASGETSCSGLHGANRLASNSLLESLVFAFQSGKCGSDYKNVKITEIPFKEKKYIHKRIDKELIDQIREKMEINVGIIRDRKGLEDTVNYLKKLYREFINYSDEFAENLICKSLIVNGLLVSEAALKREESRGSHFRKDFSFLDDRKWKKHQIFKKEDLEWTK
ncbi:L-aspartate oxidase [bacterium]|nr:L-aspartate oxidase [bacterium]